MTDTAESRARQEALADPDRRRVFAALVIEEADIGLEELADVIGTNDGLLRDEDTLWVLERRAAAPPARRAYWARAARLLARGSQSGAVWDRIISLSQTDAELAEEFSWFLVPVPLDAPWVREERERRRRVTEHHAARTTAARRAGELITRGLAGDESRRLLAWPNLLGVLAIGPDGRKMLDRFETPPTDLPGWQAASPETRARLATAAERYLVEAVPPDDDWVGSKTIPGVVVCGYAAMRLILDVRPGWLETRETPFWERWAFAVLGYPAWRDEGNGRLVRLAYARVPDRVLAVLPRLVGERELLDALDPVWDAPLAEVLISTLTAGLPSPRLFHGIATRLLEHNSPFASRRLEDDALRALEGSEQPIHLPELLLLLLVKRPALWPTLWPQITGDRALALAVLGRWAAADRYQHHTAAASEAVLGDIYAWLARAFPTPWQEPRRRARRVEADQELAQFRDNLPHAIAARGTDAAFAVLERLTEALPGRAADLREVTRRAQQQRRKQAWSPMSVEEARDVCNIDGLGRTGAGV